MTFGQAKWDEVLTKTVQFCWGSKVISLATSQSDSPYKIAAECHPAMVDPKDAEK